MHSRNTLNTELWNVRHDAMHKSARTPHRPRAKNIRKDQGMTVNWLHVASIKQQTGAWLYTACMHELTHRA